MWLKILNYKRPKHYNFEKLLPGGYILHIQSEQRNVGGGSEKKAELGYKQ